jgi:LysM repeat protein
MYLKKTISVGLILFSLFFLTHAQGNEAMVHKNYIDTYKDIAIKEMLRSGVPASITLAQGMLESDNGNSRLAKKANNHFGIKCHSDWKGQTIYEDDDRQGECFRKYKSVNESFQDHSDFLMSGSRYSFLFELEMTDYKGWAKGLKKAGYATSNTYADKLIRIIEENNLHQFDLKVAAEADHQKTHKVKKEKSSGIATDTSVLLKNRVKYIIVKPEDNFRSIQEQFDLLPFEIYKYNDMTRDQELKPGQVLYLQPKRNKAEVGNSWHIVKEGETMLMISQMYAVKPEKLYSKNLMSPGQELKIGDKISLRKQLKGKKPVVEKKKKISKEEQEDDDESELRFEFDQ